MNISALLTRILWDFSSGMHGREASVLAEENLLFPAPTAQPLCSSCTRVPAAAARLGAVHLQHTQKLPPRAITSAETPGPEERPPS